MNVPLVITNCTSRKRGGAYPITLQDKHLPLCLEAVAASWKRTLCSTPPAHAVRNLYVGRTFATAYRAARAVEGELFVASAGLGLVHEADEAPLYDLTFADKSNPLARIGANANFTPAQWWGALGTLGIGRGRINHLVQSRQPSMTLIAMPAGYLAMVATELGQLQPEQIERLRIFTSSAGVALLPPNLAECVMPYDERLEALEGYSGTRTDFAQRALLHYVERLTAHHYCAKEAKERVLSSLNGLVSRTIPTRLKATDAQIAALLRRQWKKHKGSSTQLLRYLRRDAQVACEQKRFQGIWASLRQELSTSNGRGQ